MSIRNEEIRREVRNNRIANIICDLFERNEFFNGEIFRSNLQYASMHNEDRRNTLVDNLQEAIDTESNEDTLVRFAYYTGQDCPETRNEFLRQSGFTSAEWSTLRRRGIVTEFHYDDGCAHALINLNLCRTFIMRSYCNEVLEQTQLRIEREIGFLTELRRLF